MGKEHFCPSRIMCGYGDLDLDSMASHTIWREGYIFPSLPLIPNEYAPALFAYDTRPTERVGIIGAGRLGHLAIQ